MSRARGPGWRPSPSSDAAERQATGLAQAALGGRAAGHHGASTNPIGAPRLAATGAAAAAGVRQHAEVASPPPGLEGSGQPLPDVVRREAEDRLGHDFSQVRIFSGEQTAEVADALGARAFTAGERIGFASGELAPATSAGRTLLLHELVHTVQQRASGTPALQLQPRRGGIIRISIPRLRRMLAQVAPAELTDLVRRNPMNGSFVRAREVSSGDATYRFDLAVVFNPNPIAGMQGRRGQTTPVGAPVVVEAGGRTRTTRRIRVELFTNRVSGPELVQQIPDPVDRLHSGLAETLYHELIHAQLDLDQVLPPDLPRSQTSREFSRVQDIATSLSFQLLREEVRSRTHLLFVMARSAVGLADSPTPADLPQFLEATVDFLVEEKHASQTASAAFQRRRSNADVAREYGEVVAERIERLALRQPGAQTSTPPSSLTTWPQSVARLLESVEQLFDEIDREQAHPMEEIIPGLRSGPDFVEPRPETLGLEP